MIGEHPFGNAAALWEALAQDISGRLQSAIEARGQASFVATGGRTPAPLYDVLAHRALDWSSIVITVSDDRWVDPADPASNEGLVRRHLLADRAASARFIPLRTQAATPEEGLTEVRAALMTIPRPFDVVLLGVGEDGHVASLFPAARLDHPGLAQAVYAPGAQGSPHRVSLTLQALQTARYVALLFVGERKLAVYRAARDGASETPLAALLHGAAGEVSAFWLQEAFQ